MASSVTALTHRGWIWKPAVKKESCEIDKNLLQLRVAFLAGSAVIVAIATLIPTLICRKKWIYSLPILGTSLYGLFAAILGIKDRQIAEHAADVKAVREYLSLEFPTSSASLRISQRFPAAQLLVSQRKEAINTMNDQGNFLLFYNPPLDVFTLLIENHASIERFLRLYASYRNPAYLACILKHHPDLAKILSNDNQVDLWCDIGHRDAAHLLKKYGFNVNIRNSQGYTPFLYLAHKKYQREFYIGPIEGISIHEHITALIECGADVSATIEFQDKAYTASDLTENPMVRHFIRAKEQSLN